MANRNKQGTKKGTATPCPACGAPLAPSTKRCAACGWAADAPALQEIPVTPQIQAAIKAHAGKTWGLTGAQLGATAAIVLVCSFVMIGGIGSGLLVGTLVAVGAALFAAFVCVVSYFVWQDHRRPLEADVRETHYLRLAGPMRFADARELDSDTHTWDVGEQVFNIRDDVAKHVKDLASGSVDYTKHARIILVVRDDRGQVRYQRPGL